MLIYFLVNIFGFIISIKANYLNEWAVNIDGDIQMAQSIADKYEFHYVDKIMPNYYLFRHKRLKRRSIYPIDLHPDFLSHNLVISAQQQSVKSRVKRDTVDNLYNDPMWPRMWYMHRSDGNDMRLTSVYTKYNITGRGIRVTILDDGIEKDHPDLSLNYDSGASYDVNEHDSDPQPRYDITNENRHGTRCAGEVSAQANNNICNTGIAYDSRIGGVRMLDGIVTDAVEAQSISLNPNYIHIYSASWGPDDDGKTVDGPGPLARKAFVDGVHQGRHGLGNIFVWASGNGGLKGDSCSCDGYANSIYTISISSASENGRVPWYSEACASTLATTYSSGDRNERQILTTDLRKTCTDTHTGTSASAPVGAAICALALEANSLLTWRDMQHIIVLTSRKANLIADDWVINGIGRSVSHHFGFGLMDGEAIVEKAMTWSTVAAQHMCSAASSGPINKNIGPGLHASFQLTTNGCEGQSDTVIYLEHAEAIITLSAVVRGEVELFLSSPFGTRSQLLRRRAQDVSKEGFKDWSFMTTHNWGEKAAGTWILEVFTFGTPCVFNEWSLVLSGTTEKHSDYLNISQNINISSSVIHKAANNEANMDFSGIAVHFNVSSDSIPVQTFASNISGGTIWCPPGFYFSNSCVFGNECVVETRKFHHCSPCPTSCSTCYKLSPCISCPLPKCNFPDIKPSLYFIGCLVALTALLLTVIVGSLLCFILRKRKIVRFSHRIRSEEHMTIKALDHKPLMDDASDSDFDESMDAGLTSLETQNT